MSVLSNVQPKGACLDPAATRPAHVSSEQESSATATSCQDLEICLQALNSVAMPNEPVLSLRAMAACSCVQKITREALGGSDTKLIDLSVQIFEALVRIGKTELIPTDYRQLFSSSGLAPYCLRTLSSQVRTQVEQVHVALAQGVATIFAIKRDSLSAIEALDLWRVLITQGHVQDRAEQLALYCQDSQVADVRSCALKVLGALAQRGQLRVALEPLLEKARNDADVRVRIALAGMLGDMLESGYQGEGIRKQLQGLMEDASAPVRSKAAHVWAQC